VTAFSGNWFQRRAARRKAASDAYRGLLRHALDPVHYREFGVPDTFDGRARMVTLLTSLACVRLSQLGGPEAAGLIERLDALVLDGFDAAYREKGVGDASIARKVRALAQGHAGLGKALFAALTAPDSAAKPQSVAEILRRNGAAAPDRIDALAAALAGLLARFERQPDDEILHGRFDWAGAGAAARRPADHGRI
jgi:cytochrome b pre-mRNA-processing protein 3